MQAIASCRYAYATVQHVLVQPLQYLTNYSVNRHKCFLLTVHIQVYLVDTSYPAKLYCFRNHLLLLEQIHISKPQSSTKMCRWFAYISPSELFRLAWRGSQVKSTPMLQSKSNAPYLNRNHSYLYRLVHHFGYNWRECSRRSK